MELKTYWEIIRRRKWIILQAVAIITGIALLGSFLISPIYSISAKVHLEIGNRKPTFVTDPMVVPQPQTLGETSVAEPRNMVDTYIALANTKPVVAKVIKDLDLKDILGKPIEVKDFVIGILRYPKLIVLQKKGVRLKRLGAAEVIEISGYSPRREEAATIANLVAHSFIDYLAQLYRKEVTSSRLVLGKQLEEVKKKLQKAQEAEEAFRVKNKLVEPAVQISTLITENSSLEMRRNEVERNLKEYQSNLTAIQETLKKHPQFLKKRITLESNPVIVEYKRQLLELEVELAGSAAELTDKHPAILGLQKQIAKARAAIMAEVVKTLASETTERNPYIDSLIERYGNAEISIIGQNAILTVLSNQIEEKTNEILSIPQKRKELDQLTRETGVFDTTYRSLKTRWEWLKMMEDLDIANAVTVQKAVPSHRPQKDIFFPRRLLILALSLMLSLPFGLLLAFLIDYFDDTVKTAEEVTDKLKQPLLGIIPKINRGILETTLKVDKEFWDRFWDLRSNIKLAALNQDYKILAITSVTKGEGKSTISNYLAATYAEGQQKVLLVDFNLRRPFLHQIFQISLASPGVTNFLVGERDLNEVIYPTPRENLSLMPCGTVPPSPLPILESPTLGQLMESIKAAYDQIILDTPALVDGSDLDLLSMYSDCLLFVLAAGCVSEDKFKRALENLKSPHKNVLGVVFNKSEQS